jgi:hypothetical protein
VPDLKPAMTVGTDPRRIRHYVFADGARLYVALVGVEDLSMIIWRLLRTFMEFEALLRACPGQLEARPPLNRKAHYRE